MYIIYFKGVPSDARLSIPDKNIKNSIDNLCVKKLYTFKQNWLCYINLFIQAKL